MMQYMLEGVCVNVRELDMGMYCYFVMISCLSMY